MRIARRSKSTDPTDSQRGEAARKESSDRTGTSIADPPSWATRAAPKGIARVPTHTVRPAEERRGSARAKLSLPIRVKRVAGQRERTTQTLRTMNISSSGVLFLFPQRIEPGTPIELEVRWDAATMPRLWQWVHPSYGVLGLEPANCSVLGVAHDRAEGRLPELAPGEERRTRLEIRVRAR